MDGYLEKPLIFIVDTAFYLYTLVVMLRFLLQWMRADFYNPVSQFVVKATNPVLRPLRRIIPGFWGLDMAAVVLMVVLQLVALALIGVIAGYRISPVGLPIYAFAEVLSLGINVFIFTLVVQALLSWVNPGTYNPVSALLHSMNEPLLRRIRNIIPAAGGGLDFTPMLAIFGLILLKMLLIPPLHALAQAL